jgi:hypothetical protein
MVKFDDAPERPRAEPAGLLRFLSASAHFVRNRSASMT